MIKWARRPGQKACESCLIRVGTTACKNIEKMWVTNPAILIRRKGRSCDTWCPTKNLASPTELDVYLVEKQIKSPKVEGMPQGYLMGLLPLKYLSVSRRQYRREGLPLTKRELTRVFNERIPLARFDYPLFLPFILSLELIDKNFIQH